MHRFYRWLLPAMLVAVLVSAVGCSADRRTPAQHFKKQQANTMTPHGKIMTDSVEEKDGKIQYKTEDGKQWRVTYSKRDDGTYQYGMPEEVK